MPHTVMGSDGVEALDEWFLETDTDGYLGLRVFAQQLVDRMVMNR